MKRKLYLFVLVLFSLLLVGCFEDTPVDPDDDGDEDDNNQTNVCLHEHTTWVWEEDAKCNRNNIMYLVCDDCKEAIDQKEEFKEHDCDVETHPATCTENGYSIATCKNCTYSKKTILYSEGHKFEYTIDKKATATDYGIKHRECTVCHIKEEAFAYVNNGFSSHGALHVDGVDLMDSNNQKFRLAGFSTFGLQWQPQYVNTSTFENMKNACGTNVIRLSMYTAEGGYCTGGEKMKEKLYNTVCDGIDIATALDMYVIVDWHMLGADDNYIEDENPLFFMKESMEFFDRITKQYSDHDNLLFEIMNEPSGSATWADCKKYAENVIPVIRANMPNAIVLVGNPQWTSDLASVASKPLEGFTNIMYSFHFYADDNVMTSKIDTAIKKGLPVFVTEHGGMDASGDGDINYTNLAKWYAVLDKYNISHVAWSIANLYSSSSIFKTGLETLDDFSDECLKEWGIVYKARVREIMGLPKATK